MATTTDRHLRPSDAFTWAMERDPLLRSTVVVAGVLDRLPDPDVLMERLERAVRAVPAFRERIVHPPLGLARPRWQQVEPDLAWHVRRVALPDPRSLEQLLELARTAAMTPFDPARPYWTFTLVDGFADGRSGFVLAFHHSLTDGIGGIHLAAQLFDFERDAPARPALDPPDPERLDGWRLWRDTVEYDVARLTRLVTATPWSVLRASVGAVRNPRDALRTVASVARTVEPYFDTLSPVMRERHLGRSLHVLELSLPELRAAAVAHGGRLNAAFLAGVTGGLRRYHDKHGATVGDLRMTLPLSLRAEGDPVGGNQITLLRFRLPAGLADAGERLRAAHDVVTAIRAERSLPHTQAIAAALNLLPSSVVGSMLKHVDFLASNVPGVPVPLYLAGAKVESWYPFGPTIGSAVNVTLMSYVDRCCIGVNVDVGAVPDPELLVECIADGFAEVLDLAGPNAGVRRPLEHPPRTNASGSQDPGGPT